jgi:hypothetical protein
MDWWVGGLRRLRCVSLTPVLFMCLLSHVIDSATGHCYSTSRWNISAPHRLLLRGLVEETLFYLNVLQERLFYFARCSSICRGYSWRCLFPIQRRIHDSGSRVIWETSSVPERYTSFFYVPKEHPAMKTTIIQEIMVLNYAHVVLYDFSSPTKQAHSALEGSKFGTKAGKQRVACACTVLGRLCS